MFYFDSPTRLKRLIKRLHAQAMGIEDWPNPASLFGMQLKAEIDHRKAQLAKVEAAKPGNPDAGMLLGIVLMTGAPAWIVATTVAAVYWGAPWLISVAVGAIGFVLQLALAGKLIDGADGKATPAVSD